MKSKPVPYLMGAFYTVQTSGNSVTNQIKKTISLGPKGIFGKTFESCPLSMTKGGGSATVVGVYVIVY